MATEAIPMLNRTDAMGRPTRNRLLSSIPEEEFRILHPLLEAVTLPRYQILNEAGGAIECAYFLNEGMTSLVVVTHDEESVEVGIVGQEGIVGASIVAGLKRAAFRAIMQIPGAGLKISAEKFEEILPSLPDLRRRIHHFVLWQTLQVGQVAACNRLHEIDQRLARWLLMCQDRVDSPTLPLTHEFLAQMLGAGRPTVSLACGRLENAGLIENRRAALRILDREQLEAVACECYAMIRTFSDWLGCE